MEDDMTKKQAMGREFFSSPNLLYKKELLDIGGTSIWVRDIPVKEMLDYIDKGNSMDERRQKGETVSNEEALNQAVKIILAVVCDEQGNPLGDENNVDQIKAMPNSVINKIVSKAMELSGVNIQLALKAQEVAVNLKNEGLD